MKRPKSRWLLRTGIHILVFVGLVTLTALALRPLQASMVSRMTKLRNDLIGGAEAFLGRSISYASMGPSIFGKLDIRDIRILDETGRAFITVSRLRLNYSLWELMRGRLANSLRAVDIDGPELNIDMEKDKALFEMFSSPPPVQKKAGLEFLPENFSIRFRRGVVSVMWEENQARIAGVSFDANARSGRLALSGRWNGEGRIKSEAGLFPLRMTGGIRGEIASNLESGSVNLSFPSISTDNFTMRSLAFNLAFAKNMIEIKYVQDRLPFDLYISYGTESRSIFGEIKADKFTLRDLVRLTGNWRDYDLWTAMSVSGSAFFAGGLDGKMDYSTVFSGAVPRGSGLGNASFAIDASGNESGVSVSRLAMSSPNGRLSFKGGVGFKPLKVDGSLSLANIGLFTDKGGLSGDFAFVTKGKEINIVANNASSGGVRLAAFNAVIASGNDGLDFNALIRGENGNGAEDWHNSEEAQNGNGNYGGLRLDGSFEYEGRHLEASIAASSLPLGNILRIIQPFYAMPYLPGIVLNTSDDILITTEAFITSDFNQIAYNIPSFTSVHNNNTVNISISGTDQYLELSRADIAWANQRLATFGYVDFSNPMDINFSFQSIFHETTYFVEGVFLDKRLLDIRGAYGISVNLSMTGRGGYSGFAQIDGLPIPFRGQNTRLYLDSVLRWDSRDSWSAELLRLELRDVLTPSSSNSRLFVMGNAGEKGASIPQIFFDDGRGAISGNASFSWTGGFSSVNGTILASDNTGNERYDVAVNYLAPALELGVYGSNMRLDRFLGTSYNPVLTADLRLNWTGEKDIQAEMAVSSLTAKVAGDTLSLSALASLNKEEFTVQGTHLSLGGLMADIPLFNVRLENSSVYSEAKLDGNFPEQEVELAFNIEAGFDPIDSWFDLNRLVNTIRGNINVQKARIDAVENKEPFAFAFSRKASKIMVSGGPDDFLSFETGREGIFLAKLTEPSPIRGTMTGAVRNGFIDAAIIGLNVDLKSLWRFIPRRDIISFSGGFVDADIKINGPVEDPEFNGLAHGTDLRILVPLYVRDEILPSTFDITIEESKLSFGPVPLRVGKGGGSITAGFFFDHWIPSTFTLDIAVPNQSPIPFGVDVAGIIASGLASGDLKLEMTEGRAIHVSGPLTGHDTIITTKQMDPAVQPPIPADPDFTTTTDLTIISGRKVEFAWPSDNFPMLRAYTDIGSSIKIASDDSIGTYSVVGDVSLRTGEVFYFQRSFHIREGRLTLNENETRFEPLISARAEIRDQTNEGPVTIAMVINNAPLQSFIPRFEANPPLSQFEILSLLGQNSYGTSHADGNSNRVLLDTVADMTGQIRVVRLFERWARNLLNFDMFSLRTQVLSNAAMILMAPVFNPDPVDTSVTAGNYFDNTTLFFGKYFGSNIFLQSMISFKYDPDSPGGVKVEPDFGLEIKGPFFDIKFNMVPKHLENMFLDDFSFTITRKLSF